MGKRQRGSEPEFVEHLRAECDAMARYALASGLKVSPKALLIVAGGDDRAERTSGGSPTKAEELNRLAWAHEHLARVVAPATPRTLLLLCHEKRDAVLPFLGPVRLIRYMMVVSIILLTTFILTALSPHVNDTSGDIFRSSGMELLINELFLLSAAGVGAAFAALFRASRYVAEGTYDPKYEASYWVQFILGLIAGIVLPAIIPINGGQSLTRPLLALLGGFSASVVNRILTSLTETLESLIQGDRSALMAAREQTIRVQAAEERIQDQLRLGTALLKLRSELEGGAASDQVKSSVISLIDEIVPLDGGPGSTPEDLATDHPHPVAS